jgi:predicted dehydrogenase
MAYRAGIIGCGSIASAHAGGYLGLAKEGLVELVAVADPNERVRTEFQEKYQVGKGYADAAEMLRAEQLDLVSICLWHPLHAPFTELAAEHKPRAILCEKPMATCLAEADAMIAACERYGVKLAIGHQRRFNRSWTRARELLGEGAIGKPVLVTVETGEGFLNCGTHVVDAVRYLLHDPETEWVLGAVERNSDRWERNIRIEDCGMGLIQFRGGTQALIQSDLTGTSQVESYRVQGTDGILEVDQRGLQLLHGESNGWEQIDTGYGEPWVEQAREVLTWIEGKSEHRGAVPQARATLEILMAIYQSAREHAVVKMPLEEGRSPLDLMVEEGKLPVREPGKYDIRLFLTFEPEQRRRHDELRKQGLHPREILAQMGVG